MSIHRVDFIFVMSHVVLELSLCKENQTATHVQFTIYVMFIMFLSFTMSRRPFSYIIQVIRNYLVCQSYHVFIFGVLRRKYNDTIAFRIKSIYQSI